MNDVVIAAEVAEQEFDRFLELMDVDLDLAVMDAEDRTAAEKIRRLIVKQIVAGHLTVGDDGEPTYTPWRAKSTYKEPITFRERDGGTLTAQDGKKKNAEGAKTYAMMGSLTGLHPGTFSKLKGTDIKVYKSIYTLLMD